METKLKEVIHLYIGCDAKCLSKDDQKIALNPMQASDLYLQSKGHLKDIKPVLRHFSDMTIEEATDIAIKVLFHSHIGFQPKAEKISDRWVVWSKGDDNSDVVYILFNGQICRRINGDHQELPFEYSYELIPYLLRQGFDLFHLLDTEQAINKTISQ